ncbi:MAG: ABC transporter ATP-binding protein [Pseudomonadota bacterium]
MKAVEFRALTKIHGRERRPALDGLDLDVEEGDCFGLLGPNGAGKTTAISVLCGLMRPTSGRAFVYGRDASRGGREFKSLFGLVPQDVALYQGLTARENLVFFGKMMGLSGRLARDRAAELLDEFGLAESGDRKVATFSGGMKRRINLAVGLLARPRLLILDEPTAGVDVQSRNAILELLAALNRQGTTLLYTGHYMEEIQRLCNRIAILDQGRVLEQGAKDELFARHPENRNLEEVFLALTGRRLRD